MGLLLIDILGAPPSHVGVPDPKGKPEGLDLLREAKAIKKMRGFGMPTQGTCHPALQKNMFLVEILLLSMGEVVDPLGGIPSPTILGRLENIRPAGELGLLRGKNVLGPPAPGHPPPPLGGMPMEGPTLEMGDGLRPLHFLRPHHGQPKTCAP